MIRLSGMGAVSAAGGTLPENLANLFREPEAPLPPPAFLGTSLRDPLFAVPGLGLENRCRRMLERAADEALADAGIEPDFLRGKRAGIVVGTTTADRPEGIGFYQKLREGEEISGERFLPSAPEERLREKFGTTGPAAVVSNACASGADAFLLAGLWMKSGVCDTVLVCGADELNRVPVAGFHALGVTSPEPCRPFDALRSGLNLGEGAGAVLLETDEAVRRRGGIPSDLIFAGGAAFSDAYHLTSPHPEGRGLERAVRAALGEAELVPEDIAFVNAHGTATRTNDPAEANVLYRVFGRGLRYHSTKTHTGHTLGAAGTLELAFASAMLRGRRAARAFRFSKQPDDIPVPPMTEDLVLTRDAVLSTSLAFGGCCTALVVRLEGRK